MHLKMWHLRVLLELRLLNFAQFSYRFIGVQLNNFKVLANH